MEGQTVKKALVYITAGSCGDDLNAGYLEIFFKFKVLPFVWEQVELEGSLKEWMADREPPACVVISVPLDCDGGEALNVWKIVREGLPRAPALWLIADDEQRPNFLDGDPTAEVVRILNTDALKDVTARRFFYHITELTGVRPSIEFVL